ncbi:uncharacterized protein [Palaemon carinicauda]|uniref:uncharacterized protein n=1 Tax=Palaemon carinicauda TaxID=392227 RepID=UPI0035B5D899
MRHNERPTEPRSLEEINIPPELKLSLTGDLFLVRDSTVLNDRLLVFTTIANSKRLSVAPYWNMDGTIKNVPTLFYQLYSIHAPVGQGNCRVFPLVYVLMTRKSEVMYKRLFQDFIDVADENGIELNPQIIVSDLEWGAIQPSKSEFPNVNNKLCIFHIGQRIWRRIQATGLSIRYSNEENFSLRIRQLFALAFLPSNEILEPFGALKSHLPEEAEDIVMGFENNYVLGRVRKRLRNGGVIRAPPLFPPVMWSVHDSMQLGIPRMHDQVEAWYRRWENIIERAHIGLYGIIEELRKGAAASQQSN